MRGAPRKISGDDLSEFFVCLDDRAPRNDLYVLLGWVHMGMGHKGVVALYWGGTMENGFGQMRGGFWLFCF